MKIKGFCSIYATLAAALVFVAMPLAGAAAPETVQFMSADGRTRLTGYVFAPPSPGRYPAVVMLHGRAGPYSSLKRGQHNADALTMRHKMWGQFWAERGYVAIHVDSLAMDSANIRTAAGPRKSVSSWCVPWMPMARCLICAQGRTSPLTASVCRAGPTAG
jgi:hypothetical protein